MQGGRAAASKTTVRESQNTLQCDQPEADAHSMPEAVLETCSRSAGKSTGLGELLAP